MAVSLAACGGGSSTTTTTPTTPTTPVTPSNMTITLVAGAEQRTLDAGDDTINAPQANGANTLDSLDVINGAAGTDTLNATISSAAANQQITPRTTSVEVYNITASGTNAVNLDLNSATGLTSVSNIGSTVGLVLNNIGSGVSTIAIQNTNSATTLNFLASTVAGTADAKTVSLSNVSGGQLTIDAAVESVTLSSGGTAPNTPVGLTATGASTLTVTGAQDLTIGGELPATLATVNGSAATGGLTFTSNSAVTTSITTGAGADTVNIGAAAAITQTITLGAGNDTLIMAAGTLTNADVLSGGAGTDALGGTSANLLALNVDDGNANRSGFETVRVTDALGGNITLANIQAGLTGIRLDGAAGTNAAAGRTITFEAGASTIDIRAVNNGTLTVVSSGAATTDSVTITNNDSAADVFGGNNLTFTGVETASLNLSGTGAATAQTLGAVAMAASTGGSTTLNVSGTNAVTVGAVTAGTINFAGVTATAGVTMNAAAVGGTTITGSAGNDTLLAAATGSSISGGAGDDIITGGAGNDTITGGAGDDTLNSSAGVDSLDGGAGTDRIVISADAHVSATDTYAGGDGTDTLAFGAAITNANATLSRFSGFEVLELAPNATSTLSMSNFTNNAGFTRIDVGQTGATTLTVNNIGSALNEVRLITGSDGDTITLQRLVDTTADSMTVSARAPVAVTMTMSEEETLNVSGSAAANTLTFTALTATDLTTLNVSGAANVSIANAITGATALATVNASAATGNVTVNASTSTGAVTITGGTGNDTFTGGRGADSFTGGTGTDTISYADVTAATSHGLTGISGMAINLGATSISAGTIATAMGGTVVIGGGAAEAGSALAAGTAGYLATSAAASVAGMVRDTITGFENITGSGLGDYIVGSASANTIDGGAGGDVIIGGAGADTLTGGAGADVFVMVLADAGDTIADFATGTDDIDFNTALLSIDGAVSAPTGFQSAAANTAIAATTTVFELTGVTTGGTAANLVTALGTSATNANIDAGDKLLIVNYLTAGGAQVWYFQDADGANVDAGELTLLATLTGVAADALVAGDFI